MKRYEYKVLSMRPTGLPGAPGPTHFESALNDLAKDGWAVTSCSTVSAGSIFRTHPLATAVLQREADQSPTS